jgi:hypothetical protein
MRNDARPIGEKLRDTERMRDLEMEPPPRGKEPRGRGSERQEQKPFVTDHDTGDEEKVNR